MNTFRYTPTLQQKGASSQRSGFFRKLLIANGIIAGMVGLVLLSMAVGWMTGTAGGMGDLVYVVWLIPPLCIAAVVLPLNIVYTPWFLLKARPSWRTVVLGVALVVASFCILVMYVAPGIAFLVRDAPAMQAKTRQENQDRNEQFSRQYSAISADEVKSLLLDCRLREITYYYADEHVWVSKQSDSGVELQKGDDWLSVSIDTKLNAELVPLARQARESRKTMENCQELVVSQNGSDETLVLKNGRYVPNENLPYINQ